MLTDAVLFLPDSSFSRDLSGTSAKNDEIWIALRNCRLRILSLRDCNTVPSPLPYNATSKVNDTISKMSRMRLTSSYATAMVHKESHHY